MEAPNFERITKEAGQFTSDAISTIWALLNAVKAAERQNFRITKDILQPKVITLAPAASVDNLDLQGSSVVSFTGASAQNFTGARAPETGSSQVLIVHVSGAGTITVKNDLTSDTANRFVTSSGSDVTLATGSGIIFAYLAGKWREVA